MYGVASDLGVFLIIESKCAPQSACLSRLSVCARTLWINDMHNEKDRGQIAFLLDVILVFAL